MNARVLLNLLHALGKLVIQEHGLTTTNTGKDVNTFITHARIQKVLSVEVQL